MRGEEQGGEERRREETGGGEETGGDRRGEETGGDRRGEERRQGRRQEETGERGGDRRGKERRREETGEERRREETGEETAEAGEERRQERRGERQGRRPELSTASKTGGVIWKSFGVLRLQICIFRVETEAEADVFGQFPEFSHPLSSSGGSLRVCKDLTCYDWGESREGAVSVLDGEVGWLSCPLFSHPSVYNYTTGHDLFWYHLPEGQDLEQPIKYSTRLSKDRHQLWLQPAAGADTGLYICMLRNRSSCSKIAMRLKVLRPDEVAHGSDCQPPVAVAPTQVNIGLQEGRTLDCPDYQDAAKMADSELTVTWQHVRPKTVYSMSLNKLPTIFHPAEEQIYTVKQGNVKYDHGDRTEQSVLVIKDFQSQDLKREFNCSMKNERGSVTRRAQLQEEVSLPTVELGCGLGVTLVLMLLLFVVYHVFWLELLLLYTARGSAPTSATQGDKSKDLTSRFWKRLRVELPVRRVSRDGGGKDAALMRMMSQNSTNSQTGLITDTTKDPQKVLNAA
ncbi:Interleukin-1 receptor accessory protein [Nibea albiflora]|uniref:Interleukin-1 receptor accessory protein n=1 Tax=Nibea albiflora TaxID=240163 RepID=A0ACB7EHU9_NIBAL|nr:Interleukin-1 receptor accessory protein [Nibea albiflora]